MSDFMREHLRNEPVAAEQAPWTLPDQALTFASTDEITPIVTASGNRYLRSATQAQHGNRIESGLHGDRFFVVSHATQDRSPVYTVNWASRAPGDTHITINRFDDVLSSRAAAHALAGQAVRQVEGSPALEAVPRAKPMADIAQQHAHAAPKPDVPTRGGR